MCIKCIQLTNNKTCLAYLFLIINNYGGLFKLFGIITCNAVLTFIFPASSLFCLVLQKTKEKRAFLSGGWYWARSIQPTFRPVRPGKEDHLKRWTCFFETFPVGPNRSIEFWTEISGKFGWMDRAHYLHTDNYHYFEFQFKYRCSCSYFIQSCSLV